MRQNPQKQPLIPQLSRVQSSQSTPQLLELRQKLKILKQTASQKQNQLLALSTQLRNQGLRNQKYKKEVVEIDDRIGDFVKKQVEVLFQKYKNSDSPLFHNQAGLSPFQLLRIGEHKFQEMTESHICMVCFSDLQKNIRIMKLPCGHIVHKQCGIQHLLYNKNCPACGKELK